jgi:hypothetical protein
MAILSTSKSGRSITAHYAIQPTVPSRRQQPVRWLEIQHEEDLLISESLSAQLTQFE